MEQQSYSPIRFLWLPNLDGTRLFHLCEQDWMITALVRFVVLPMHIQTRDPYVNFEDEVYLCWFGKIALETYIFQIHIWLRQRWVEQGGVQQNICQHQAAR